MNTKPQFILSKITCGIWFFLAAFNLIVRVIILGQYANIVTAIFALIFALIILKMIKTQRKKPIVVLNIVGASIVLLAYLSFIGAALFSCISRKDPITATCYSVDIKYIQTRFHSADEGEFPEKLPKDISNCTFDFMPSVLQGDGYTRVTFTASDEVYKEYVSKYSSMAGTAPKQISECADFNIPLSITQDHPDAEVYVIRSNNSPNHFHSFVFVCDDDTNMIALLENG